MPDDLLQQLSALEAELHHPGVRCSRERLLQLLHPAFHEVGRSGMAYDLDTVINFLLKEAASSGAVEAWDYRVFELGPDAVLLTYQSRHVSAEGAISHAARRSSVWRRTAQGWQLFYHQGTPAEGLRP